MQCFAFTFSTDAQLGRCAPKRGKTRQKRPLFGYRLITRFYRPRLACCHARQGARSAAAGQRGILPPRCRSRCRSSLQLVNVSRSVHAGAGNLSGVSLSTIDKDAQSIPVGAGNLSAYERTKLALRLEEAIAGRAKANQSAGGGAVPQKSAEPVDTRQEIAKAAGVSHDTVAGNP